MRETIQTKRLTLRPFRPADASDILSHVNDLDIARQTASLPSAYTREMADDWVRVTADRSRLCAYAITQQDVVIGSVAIVQNDSLWDLGYWLGRSHWRHGLMREAVSALLAEITADSDISQLTASVFTDNPRSLALLESVGFTRTDKVQEVFCVARASNVTAYTLTWDSSPASPAISVTDDLDFSTFQALRATTDWGVPCAEVSAAAIANSLVTATAWHGPRAIGMIRSIGDGALNAYIQDLIVDPAYRGKGVGRKLMKHALARLDGRGPHDLNVGLISAVGIDDFYTQLGFRARPNPEEGAGFQARLCDLVEGANHAA